MSVAVGARATSKPGGRQWHWVPRALIGLAVVAVAAFIGLNAWIHSNPPITAGSVVAMLGENGTDCDPLSFGGDASVGCYEVPFAEGEGVGIGFAVRNTAPVPMTIVRVEGLEPPFLAPAYLHPELTEDGVLFGLGAGRPFEPVEVAPHQEVPLQLVGTFLGCEEVARSRVPGGSLIIDHARLTVRWAFVETDVDVQFRAALSLPAPDNCGP